MAGVVRKAVSKEKRRYVDKKNGFDLDLSYVTNSIIAMGFPSESMEGIYRNPYSEVIRFLDLEHKDSFKVYNLCSERGYDHAKFYDRVSEYPHDDHNPPPFEMIQECCEDMDAFLKEKEGNVIVVHCKAGKGRTGTIICCYLVWNREWPSADDAMSYYAAMRTYNKKGVTIPSQKRQIGHFAQYIHHGRPADQTLYVDRITMSHIPLIDHPNSIRVSLLMNKRVIFTHKGLDKKIIRETSKRKGGLVFECGGVPVFRDVKCIVEHRAGGLTGREDVLFAFWFHTSFINFNSMSLVLLQDELDNAHKDRSNKIFPRGFRVEIMFRPLEGPLEMLPAPGARRVSLATAASASSSDLTSSRPAQKSKTAVTTRRDYSQILQDFPSLVNL